MFVDKYFHFSKFVLGLKMEVRKSENNNKKKNTKSTRISQEDCLV